MAQRACSAINGSGSLRGFFKRRQGGLRRRRFPRPRKHFAADRGVWSAPAACRQTCALKAASSSCSSSIKSGWRKSARACGRIKFALAREPVPRADRQAIVAAKNPVANGRAQFDRNRALQLNRQIRDAFAGIQLKGRRDGLGGTGREAAGAFAAMIFFRCVGRQFSVVKISARKIQLPRRRLMRLVCLPTKPRPARWAKSRSNTGPVSTYQSERVVRAAELADEFR